MKPLDNPILKEYDYFQLAMDTHYNELVCDRGCCKTPYCPICGKMAEYQGLSRCLPPNAIHGNWEGHTCTFAWCGNCAYYFKVKPDTKLSNML